MGTGFREFARNKDLVYVFFIKSQTITITIYYLLIKCIEWIHAKKKVTIGMTLWSVEALRHCLGNGAKMNQSTEMMWKDYWEKNDVIIINLKDKCKIYQILDIYTASLLVCKVFFSTYAHIVKTKSNVDNPHFLAKAE